MRLGVVVAGACAFIFSTYLVVFMLSPRPNVEVKQVSKDPAEDFPPVSKAPPYPKAVMDETEFEFGRMEVGEERSHVFMIRNEGDAPLIIKQGPTTCQCTVGSVETDNLAA